MHSSSDRRDLCDVVEVDPKALLQDLKNGAIGRRFLWPYQWDRSRSECSRLSSIEHGIDFVILIEKVIRNLDFSGQQTESAFFCRLMGQELNERQVVLRDDDLFSPIGLTELKFEKSSKARGYEQDGDLI